MSKEVKAGAGLLAKWYYANVLKNDTVHPFLDYLPEAALRQAADKAAKAIFNALERVGQNGKVHEDFKDIIAFYSPWPAWAKHFKKITDNWVEEMDVMCFQIAMNDEQGREASDYSTDDFLQAYLGDGGKNDLAIRQIKGDECY